MPRLGEASLSSAPPPYWRKPLNSSRGRCGLRAPRSLLRALAGGSVCVVSCDRGSAGRAVDADSFRDGSDSLVSGRGAAGKGDSLGRSRQSGEAGFDGADGPWGRLGLNLADGVFQGQALAGDLGLRKGRIYAAKLRHQGRAGALIKCAPPVRGIVRKPLYGPGDEWMIVCHCSQFTLDSLKLHLMLRMGFA